MKTAPIIMAASLAAYAVAGHAASFDCAKAGTWVEKTVCEQPKLNGLDETMARAFDAARSAQQDASGRERLLEAQRSWLKQRNRCDDVDCLILGYNTRIAELTAGRTASGATQDAEINHTGPGFSVTAHYPVFEDPALTPVNTQARTSVQTLVNDFVSEHESEGPELSELHELPPWSLEVGYQQPYRASRYVVVELDGYEYRGGAHGMPIIAPLILGLPDGRRVASEDLFAPGSNWIEVLSEICYRMLSASDDLLSDDDWLKRGTAPEPENYRLLAPLAEGLTVHFPPYEVAPYAAGPQSVIIPYSELAGLLNPRLFPR